MPSMALVCQSLPDEVVEAYYSCNVFTPKSALKHNNHPDKLCARITCWCALLGTDVDHLRRLQLTYCFSIVPGQHHIYDRFKDEHLHCRLELTVSTTNEVTAKRAILKLRDNAEHELTNDFKGSKAVEVPRRWR